MKLYIIFYTIFLTFFTTLSSFAQQNDEELAGNINYRNYKIELDTLVFQQKYITLEISKFKELSISDSLNRDDYVSRVISLENNLFDLRNKMGVLSSKCSSIEQEYIIKNLNRKNKVDTLVEKANVSSNINILLNKYIIDNTTPEEIEILKSSPKIDSIAFSLRDSLKKEFDIVRNIDNRLRSTQVAELADSLFDIAETSQEIAYQYNGVLKEAWGDIFDTKIYVYARLLDKLNVSVDVLTQLSNKYREVKSISDEVKDSKFSPIFSSYALKRELVLDYEKLLAEKLAYLPAIDSLNKAIAKIKTFQYEDSAVELPDWDYVSFKRAKIGGTGVHSSRKPIPEVEIPTFGSVYMLKILTLNRKLVQILTLKKVNTVSYFINQLGKYEYYAGVYPSEEEAEKDLSKLRKLGFRVSIVQWREGGKVFDGDVIIPINVFQFSYKIEFDSVTPELTAKLKELAPTKELSKIEEKYFIGIFDNYLDAINIMKKIGVGCKIIGVDINNNLN